MATALDIFDCYSELARLGWKVEIGNSGMSLKLICTRGSGGFVCVGQVALEVWKSAVEAAHRQSQ